MKAFTVCCYVFLGILACMIIPYTLIHKQYSDFVAFIVVVTLFLVISTRVRLVVEWPANDFVLHETELELLYDKRTESIGCSDISQIIITQYRYIFRLKSGKKYAVTRIIGARLGGARLQKSVDQRIFDIALKYSIPYKQKFWF